ncbi:MAG: ATP-binding protein, partial [Alphaproteobacteria bacterium]
MVPVPADAPPRLDKHPTRGKPIAEWTYRDGDGRVLGYVWRFDEPGGGKAFIPLTWCKHSATGRGGWRWKSWAVPRPLYRLDALAAQREAPVIVCEGEKAADAAAKLLPGWVSTTSPNGTNGAGKADWAPLAGRRVVIWPDADDPGMKYAASIVRALERVSAAVLVIEPPPDVEPGWDAADALAEGWDKERARVLVDAARPLSEAMLKPHDTADRTVSGGAGFKKRSPGVGSKLVELADEAELWHSPNCEPYATVQVGDHHEHWLVKSKGFRRWLGGCYYDDRGGVPGGQALQDALNTIEMKAIRGPEYPTFLRVGEREGKAYLDLGDKAWRAVEITENGWEAIGRPPVKFLRTGAVRALPEPERGESIDVLQPFLNTATEADFKLVVACLVGWLRPRGPYPILTIAGEQGSAKSTMVRVLR